MLCDRAWCSSLQSNGTLGWNTQILLKYSEAYIAQTCWWLHGTLCGGWFWFQKCVAWMLNPSWFHLTPPRLINPFGEQKSLSLWSCFQPPSFHHGCSSSWSYLYCLCHPFFLALTLPYWPKAKRQFAWSCPKSVILYAVVSLLLFNILFLRVLSRDNSTVHQGTNCNLAKR